MTDSRTPDYRAIQRKHCDELRALVDPPAGYDSWLDYATAHQHVDSARCWQCVAREKALAEQRALFARIGELLLGRGDHE